MTPLIGAEPRCDLTKSFLHNEINSFITSLWHERWSKRTDSRQTAIFFERPNPQKSKELIKLPKEQIAQMVRALSGHDFRRRHEGIVNKTTELEM